MNLELRMTGGDVKLPIWGMSIKNRAKFQGYRAILERNRAIRNLKDENKRECSEHTPTLAPHTLTFRTLDPKQNKCFHVK